MDELLLLNGPNLGRLGRHQPKLYGTDTLDDVVTAITNEVASRGWKVRSVQRNSDEYANNHK